MVYGLSSALRSRAEAAPGMRAGGGACCPAARLAASLASRRARSRVVFSTSATRAASAFRVISRDAVLIALRPRALFIYGQSLRRSERWRQALAPSRAQGSHPRFSHFSVVLAFWLHGSTVSVPWPSPAPFWLKFKSWPRPLHSFPDDRPLLKDAHSALAEAAVCHWPSLAG